MVAARVANMGEGRPKRETGGIQPVSQSRAAELLNTSRDSVKAARKVLEKGAPELVRAVDQGRIAVSAAKTITVDRRARTVNLGFKRTVPEAAVSVGDGRRSLDDDGRKTLADLKITRDESSAMAGARRDPAGRGGREAGGGNLFQRRTGFSWEVSEQFSETPRAGTSNRYFGKSFPGIRPKPGKSVPGFLRRPREQFRAGSRRPGGSGSATIAPCAGPSGCPCLA
jgi:hypothetical protein